MAALKSTHYCESNGTICFGNKIYQDASPRYLREKRKTLLSVFIRAFRSSLII